MEGSRIASGVLITIVATILAVLSGWLVPLILKSRRPYGAIGDILVCVAVTAPLAFVEWVWLLPPIARALGFESIGPPPVAFAIGDPLGFGLICLWLMRKIRS